MQLPKLKYSCGDVVRVKRAHPKTPEFQDMINSIDIVMNSERSDVEYYFKEEDDAAKEEEIVEVIAKVRTFDILPEIRYKEGDVVKFLYEISQKEDKGVHRYAELSSQVQVILCWNADPIVRYFPKIHDKYVVDWIDQEEIVGLMKPV